jgi:hypothetical protein
MFIIKLPPPIKQTSAKNPLNILERRGQKT